jgi:tripartite-type tricarboxylate transporter receptor subunit TctC
MAESFPEKPITLVVPFASGGSIDAAIRVVQPRLSAELGQPVVIENLGGAGGALGAAKVANAAKDGYTLLVGSINDVVLVPMLNKNVRYGTKDFTLSVLSARTRRCWSPARIYLRMTWMA